MFAAAILHIGCGSDEGVDSGWRGRIDTTADGTVLVTNPSRGLWDADSIWRIQEVVRIGSADGRGPDVFGRLISIEVDGAGRIYAFDGQAQELRVFDTDGAHIRTIGRKGGGPGEFRQVIGMAWGPEGDLWVVDPSNNRVSVIDTAGQQVADHVIPGGFVIMPWPGGFDDAGRFYNVVPDPGAEGFRTALVQYDSELEPLDTIQTPIYPGEGNFFEARSESGYMRATVPFSPGLVWRLASSGRIWFALTGEYRLFERTLEGDTLRVISRESEPLPVSGVDIDSAIASLEWFTRQGGKIDRSKFPSVKPAISTFFLSDDGTIWVVPVTEGRSRERFAELDVFDDLGRYLGRLGLPFTLGESPTPIFRGGTIYGVSHDELDVPYVVVGRILGASTHR